MPLAHENTTLSRLAGGGSLFWDDDYLQKDSRFAWASARVEKMWAAAASAENVYLVSERLLVFTRTQTLPS